MRGSVLVMLAALTLGGARAAAQNPPPRPPPPQTDTALQRPARGDSVRPRPPISPTGAFFRSLVIPGWGQSRLNRNVMAGLFISFEALAGAMVWKSQWQLEFARTRDKFVKEHTQEREDWIVLLAFNHLLSAAEAYVSAHLWDFPPALKFEPLPGGAAGLGVAIPIRVR